jgi:hypothetical protein
MRQRIFRSTPETGDVFEHRYPFVRDTYVEPYADEDGIASREIPCWKPGVRHENTPTGDTEAFADGVGWQIITVVGRFKPGRFPERVFFTRKWRDPDGREFGKGGCRVVTMQVFRSLTSGYRHEYLMAGESRSEHISRTTTAAVEFMEAMRKAPEAAR